MGLSSKTAKNTVHRESSSSMERTNPAWVADALKGYTDRVGGLMNKSGAELVPGADPLQTRAATSAMNLGGYGDDFADAGGMARAAANGVRASSLLEGLGDYMSPYTDAVVDTTLQGFDDATGESLAQTRANAAKADAFGGSRFGVQTAQLMGKAMKDRAGLEAGLRDQGFTRGADLSDRDANRRQDASTTSLNAKLQAAGLLGTLGNSRASNARSDIDTQAGIGSTMRGIAGQQSDMGILGSLGDLLSKGQYGLFSGVDTDEIVDELSKTKQNGGLLGSLGSIAQIASAAAAFSDARTKRDVETLGVDDRGRRWVAYRYLWDADDAPLRTGVMAQEVAETEPEAVMEGPLGFLMVDYGKLTETGQWRAS
jgi:hypothetical protein